MPTTRRSARGTRPSSTAEWVFGYGIDPQRWLLYRVGHDGDLTERMNYPARPLLPDSLALAVAEHTGPDVAEILVNRFVESHPDYFIYSVDPPSQA